MTSILEQDIDLNKLFHLNHSFDLLKTVIEALLKSNKNLEKRLSDLEGDREKQENKLKDEIDRLKGIYNEKFNVIFSRLDKHEGDIASINLKIDGLCSQEDMEDLKKKVEKNSNGIDKHSEQIEDSKWFAYLVYKRLKKLDELIEGINIRLSEMNVFQLPQKDDEELSDTDRFLKLLESLKVTIFNKLGNLDSRLEEDERDISGIKADIQALKEKSAYFNENITILFAKIEELKNLIHKSPNDDVKSLM